MDAGERADAGRLLCARLVGIHFIGGAGLTLRAKPLCPDEGCTPWMYTSREG